MKRHACLVLLGLLGAFLTACQTPPQTIEKFDRGTGEFRIMLMPLDIELSELNASGLLEPNAEWTQKARTHITDALKVKFKDRKARLVAYAAQTASLDTAMIRRQIINLHSTVGFSIVRHHFSSATRLPHKEGRFDWVLGKSVKVLGQGSDARYALFVYVRDSYSSGGRVAVQVLGALFGAIVRGGSQAAFASLVDLSTGKIVWFNFVKRGTGDVREAASAKESVATFMESFPK